MVEQKLGFFKATMKGIWQKMAKKGQILLKKKLTTNSKCHHIQGIKIFSEWGLGVPESLKGVR